MRDNAAILILILPFLLIFGLYVWSIIWAFGDAEARGKSGCLVALLVMFLSWPLGLIAWIIFRPDTDRRNDPRL